MAKIRISAIAKEIGKESKEVIAFVTKELKDGKNYTAASNLEDKDADLVRAHFLGVREKKGPVLEKKAPVLEKKAPVLEKKAPVLEKKAPSVEKKPAEEASPETRRKATESAAAGTTISTKDGKKVFLANRPDLKAPVLEKKPAKAAAPEPEKKAPVLEKKPAKAAAPEPEKKAPVLEKKPVKEAAPEPEKKAPVLEKKPVKEAVVVKTEEKPVPEKKPEPTEPAVKVSVDENPAPKAEPVKKAPTFTPKIAINIQGNVGTTKPKTIVVNNNDRKAPGRNPNFNRDNNRPFHKDSRPGSDKGFQRDGNRPANRDNNRPFNKDGRPGSKDNSKIVIATNTDATKKRPRNDSKDKDRFNSDRTGKHSENFKNLSRDVRKKEEIIEEKIKMITLPEVITLAEFANRTKIKAAELIKKLFLQGKMVTLNTEISYEEAENLALEYDILCEKEVEIDVIEELLKETGEDEKEMIKRPPVVCVMGHVDHGKTSLLDAIRSTNVTSREAGGITQHIGAYMVECKGEPITFLDTPGHEAFTAMRMRGAQSTDIAVLVVAADDGVKPQTIEAIHHAKAAGVDVIVAMNKMDKPTANPDRVRQELAEHEIVSEDWGGNVPFVEVSAKTHQNIDQLLEMILLVAEVKELKANPNREVRGIVIEAKLDKGRGPVATVLVQKGTLKQGDFVSCGSYYGRVRAMVDADGNALKKATPSTPCEILGLNGVPNAGEGCIGHKNEKESREYADTFIAEEKKKMLAETKRRLTMDSLFAEIQAGNIKELPLVVKADVQGSVEAVRTSLEKLSTDEVAVKVIHGGVGAINESDITLASASNALVIGFNVKPDPLAKQLAESENVDVKLYRVIYQAIDDVEAAIKGMEAPVYEEKIIGHAEVRMTFKSSEVGVIAGSYVLDGVLERNCSVRVKRGKDLIYEGALASLKRFKDDAKEVKEGFECGVVLEKFSDLREGDQIEAYKMVQVEKK